MNCGKLLAGLALGALLASPVAAQTRASEDETIVVTGTRMTRGEAFEMARRYTRAVLAIPQADQNARWADPLCIGAIGLRPEVATPLIDRGTMETFCSRTGRGKWIMPPMPATSRRHLIRANPRYRRNYPSRAAGRLSRHADRRASWLSE